MKQFSKDLGNVSIAPKGKWSREQEYERLALVYNAYDNLSYIAKINVPIGVDIENREYWQPMNATGYADNNFINLTVENENGTITAYESLEEAVATILPINRRAGATLSFYNLNSDRLDRQAEFELWQFNSTDLANWENRDYWNNIYYNWNVFVGWYIGVDALTNHVKLPTVGQYAYVGSNLNDAILYQCRTNGTWTNTGIKVRNYISVVVSGNVTIGENGNWFSDGKDTGIPATPAVDEQLDDIIIQLQQHTTEISNLKKADANLQDQITSNDSDITSLTAKHKSLSRTVQDIAVTGGASAASNVTYNNDSSGLNAENAQDAIDELQSSKFDKTSILQELGNAEDKVMSQKAVSDKLSNLSDIVGIKTKINTTSNYNHPINISLKKGDTLYLSVSSFNKNGTGDAVVCFFSTTTRKYFCQLRNDGEVYYTADSDVIIDKLQVNLASGVTNVSADVKFGYGQIYTNKQLIENQSKKITNNESNIDDILNVQVGKTIPFDTLSITTTSNVATIKGNFCKGQKISLITRNFSVQYTGNIALTLYNPISKKYDATFNGNSSFGNQKVFGEVSANTKTYLLQMIVSGGSIKSLTGFVQVNIDEIAYETSQEIKSFTPILDVIKASNSDYINFATKSITGWVYGSKGNDIIFGIDRPTDKDIVIKNISMVIFSDDCNYDNTVMEFLVGTIDQRGWILYNRYFSAKASKVAKMNYKVAIDNEVLKKGECLFVKLKCLSATGATIALDTATYNPNKKVAYTTNINSSVIKDETKGYYGFVVDAVEVESIFAYKQDIENINTDLQAVSSRVDNINILSDTVTGDKYKIVITNGEIIAKPLNYKKGLIIGNSYSNYGPSGTTWFSYNCMAASTEKTQWFKLIQSKNGCVFSVKSGVDFERNYSVSYDFSKLGLTNEYDVVIIQLGENTTYSDTMDSSFAALIKHVKSICIKADIYVMLGSPAINGDRSTALINAANKNNVQIINCMSVSLVGRYSLGDYVSSESDGMDYIQNSGVSDGHPSDIGQLNMANKCLKIFGNESINDRLFKLNLQQTSGGSITTVYPSWVSGGIVSVRCKANESYTIQSISVTTTSKKNIEATKRTNEYGVYYTFIMPNEDVIITPSFSEL